jgi:hypothetical protein
VEASPLRQASAAKRADAEGTSGTVVATSATSESESHEEKFEQLDVEFSLMVAQPTTQWNLQPLMLRAQEIARSTQSPMTREKALALLERMRRFEHLQKGTAPLGSVVVPTVAATRPTVAQPASYGVAPPPVATGGYNIAPAAGVPTRSGLPKLLAALESLMPPGPPQSRGGPPAGPSAPPPAAGASSPVSPVAVQSPTAAAAVSDGLVWGARNPHTAPGAAAVGVPAAASPDGGVSPAAAAINPGGVGSTPADSAESVNVFGRLAGAVLYPFGSGQPHDAAAAMTPDFDGRGRLMPLVSRKGGPAAGRQYVPPYVLTDEQGNITQFVTPAPGMNLHRYVNQEIGVFGQRRSLDHLQQPHVTASRVVQLDRHRR